MWTIVWRIVAQAVLNYINHLLGRVNFKVNPLPESNSNKEWLLWFFQGKKWKNQNFYWGKAPKSTSTKESARIRFFYRNLRIWGTRDYDRPHVYMTLYQESWHCNIRIYYYHWSVKQWSCHYRDETNLHNTRNSRYHHCRQWHTIYVFRVWRI